MIDVLNLALPFFGLIFIGFACGRIKQIPDTAPGENEPGAIDRLLQFLQNAAAPCALFALGVTVALRPLKKIPWEIPPLAFVKLLLHPVLLFVLLSLFGPFDQVWIDTALLMAALPPALNVFVFARQYDAWVEQASSAVLVGTLLSVVTLTSVMWMVKTGHVPALLFR